MRAKKVPFISNRVKAPHLHAVTKPDLIAAKQREIHFLVSEIRQLKADVRFKDSVIREVVDLLEAGMIYRDWPTMGQIITVVNRLKYAGRGK